MNVSIQSKQTMTKEKNEMKKSEERLEREKNARDIAITKQTETTFGSGCSCFTDSLLCR
jgi:hypothetical protein